MPTRRCLPRLLTIEGPPARLNELHSWKGWPLVTLAILLRQEKWRVILLIWLGCVPTSANVLAADLTYAERLGWPPGAKVVIFHVDDAGMSHDSNVGAIEAVEKGVATSMSIMFPCPWTTEIVRYVKQHPKVDAGIHITLTSEWNDYRWGPLSGKRQVPSLVDQDGFFWKDVLKVALRANANDVETEILAQLEQCRTMGMRPTHLDTHMGSVFCSPTYLQRYRNIAIKTGIPIMLPAGRLEQLTAQMPWMALPLRQLGNYYGKQLWDAGLPVIDDLQPGSNSDKAEQKKKRVVDFLHTVKPGITQFVVHCTRPSDSFKAISESGPIRLAELKAMLDPEVKKIIKQENIILTNWRELTERRAKVK